MLWYFPNTKHFLFGKCSDISACELMEMFSKPMFARLIHKNPFLWLINMTSPRQFNYTLFRWPENKWTKKWPLNKTAKPKQIISPLWAPFPIAAVLRVCSVPLTTCFNYVKASLDAPHKPSVLYFVMSSETVSSVKCVGMCCISSPQALWQNKVCGEIPRHLTSPKTVSQIFILVNS